MLTRTPVSIEGDQIRPGSTYYFPQGISDKPATTGYELLPRQDDALLQAIKGFTAFVRENGIHAPGE